MAWSTPLTAVANTALTAAQWNASVRDNLLETAPAKATTARGIFVATGTNAIAQRTISEGETDGSDSTTSTTYTSLASTGPSLASVATGTGAMVHIQAQQENSSANIGTWTSFQVSGASTIGSNDDYAVLTNTAASQAVRAGTCTLHTTLTVGNNTFSMEYRVTSGTGSWQRRRIQVMAL